MSIDGTDPLHVALFDTTTGETIGGPLFDSDTDAREFIEWADVRLLGADAHVYPTPKELIQLQKDWEAERHDDA